MQQIDIKPRNLLCQLYTIRWFSRVLQVGLTVPSMTPKQFGICLKQRRAYLKCHYDENRIFSFEAILKHRQVACMKRKMLFTIFKYLFLFQRYLSFLKYANQPSDGIIYSTKFWWNMMKKDISANLYQKCLILYSKIQLNVLHNLSLTVLLPWQHTRFQTSPILKAFLATFGIPFSYLRMVPHVHDPTSI